MNKYENMAKVISIFLLIIVISFGIYRYFILEYWIQEGGTVDWFGNILAVFLVLGLSVASIYLSFYNMTKMSFYVSLFIILILALSVVSLR